MNNDFRVSTGFFNHIKTKKLRRALGADGVLAILQIWAYAAQHCPSGVLCDTQCDTYSASECDSVCEDIAMICDWKNDAKTLVKQLFDIGFLDFDKTSKQVILHDWKEHNGWVYGFEERSKRMKSLAEKRWSKQSEGVECDTHATRNAQRNAPLPSPLPLPSPIKTLDHPAADRCVDQPKRRQTNDVDFDSFWSAYPRKTAKGNAKKVWDKLARSGSLPSLSTLIAAVESAKGSDQWSKDGGQFIPHPATWLNQARWEDEHDTEPEWVQPVATQEEIDLIQARRQEQRDRELEEAIKKFGPVRYGDPQALDLFAPPPELQTKRH